MSLDSAVKAAQSVFSETYFEAREKFAASAPASTPYPCSAKGPDGEALYTDTAYFGDPNASRLLVLVSATHGLEGYCGSAAQLLFLHANLHEQLPSSTAVLLVHALNCYGFAWNRRVTAEGCDLNRNFVDFNSPVPANPGYEELAEHLVPADVSQAGLRKAESALAEFRSLHGEKQFMTARSSGQYTRPGGLFYGGREPTEARRTLEKIANDFDIEGRDQVVIIDYHTGIGPYGHGDLMSEIDSGEEGYQRAVNIFGPSVTSPDLDTFTAAAVNGSQDAFWQRLLGDRHTYVALEFGTYGHERGRHLMRNDHWLFMYKPEEAISDLGREIRDACKVHWYPQRLDWKEMVLWRSHQVHRQAIEALASSANR